MSHAKIMKYTTLRKLRYGDTNLLKVKKDKVVPVHAMKAYSESRGMAPLILKLESRWR
jgi:hypothetical protein